MLETLLCTLVILVFLIVRRHPTLARALGESMDEFRKELERHLSRLGEELYWSQYESGNSQNWQKRWKPPGRARKTRFWASRKGGRLGVGRMMKQSPY